MAREKAFLAMALAALFLISFMPMDARAAPTITEVNHTWKYPQAGESVEVTARITDPQGVTTVTLFFCTIPGGACQFPQMFDPDSDNVYNQTVTPTDFAASTGADFYINAMNSIGEFTETEKRYVHFAKSINVTAVTDKTHVIPGERFNLTVGAVHDGNASAMVEYSDVLIERLGSAEQFTGKTNETGNVTIGIDAPAAVGTYTYRVTVSNRSLSGQAEANVLVQVEDLPDLVAEAEDIVLSDNQPDEGDSVTANVTIENWGTLNAKFRVLITLEYGDTTQTLTNVSITVAKGEDAHITVSWIVARGLQYVNVTVDPGDFVREVSETNNRASIIVTGIYTPPRDNETPWLLYAGIAIIVIAVLAGIMVMVRRKKSGPPEGEEDKR